MGLTIVVLDHSQSDLFIHTVTGFDKNTQSEVIETYLVSIGFKLDQIDYLTSESTISIYLEPVNTKTKDFDSVEIPPLKNTQRLVITSGAFTGLEAQIVEDMPCEHYDVLATLLHHPTPQPIGLKKEDYILIKQQDA